MGVETKQELAEPYLGLRLVHSAPHTVPRPVQHDDIVEESEFVACQCCGYKTVDCNNWIGGRGRLCGMCASDHFGESRF